MTEKVQAYDNLSRGLTISARGFPGGTPLIDAPTIVLVLESESGYLGHIELAPTSAQILGEEIRRAAEAAQTTLEEE